MAPQLIYSVFLSLFAVLGSSAPNECQVEKCTQHGPAIRFPFSLKDRHQQHCDYPGFELHCTQNSDTVLELPFPMKASIEDSNLPFWVQFAIEEIDYKKQLIQISRVFGCFRGLLPILNLSASPFQFLDADSYDFTFFNCSKIKRDYDVRIYNLNPVPCLSSTDYDVYSVPSDYPLYELPLQSCSKMFDIHSMPSDVFDRRYSLQLEWSTPSCRLKNDSSILHDTECKPPGIRFTDLEFTRERGRR